MYKQSSYDEQYYESGKGSNYYDYSWNPSLIEPRLKEIINLTKLKPPARILDFGCAKGFYVRWLRQHGFNAIGIDGSKYATSMAPADIHHHIICGDHKILSDFEDEEFDLIIAKDVLEHIEKNTVSEVVQQLDRISKCLLICVPYCDIGGKFVNAEDEQDNTHLSRYTDAQWMKIFRRAKRQDGLCIKLKKEKAVGTLCVTIQ